VTRDAISRKRGPISRERDPISRGTRFTNAAGAQGAPMSHSGPQAPPRRALTISSRAPRPCCPSCHLERASASEGASPRRGSGWGWQTISRCCKRALLMAKMPANARAQKSPANARCRGCRQGGVVPASSHSHAEKDGEVDMLRADVKDSAWSAADVASMMACSTPGHVSIRVGCVALG